MAKQRLADVLTTKYSQREGGRGEGRESADAVNMPVNCHLRSAAALATVQESDAVTNQRIGSLISCVALTWKCKNSLWKYEQERIAIAKKADRTAYAVRYSCRTKRLA